MTTIIKRHALVPYTSRQMFELVNNVADYPRFLQWCRHSHILSQNEQEIKATLEIVWSGIHKNFTTCNHLHPFERIEITLVEGPFRHLEGVWLFMPVGEQGCNVMLNLEFELAGSLVNKLFEPIFNRIANSLVDAFCKRASEIYGY
jgi:ribosome-associated toxin RatA of RatAB toxin-antitoxin module